jgi:hypothetical protein
MLTSKHCAPSVARCDAPKVLAASSSGTSFQSPLCNSRTFAMHLEFLSHISCSRSSLNIALLVNLVACLQLTSMEFIVDRSNGKSKGCVLVEFETPEAAVQCKEQLHGCVLPPCAFAACTDSVVFEQSS